MSTTPTRPSTEPEVDDETRRMIEERHKTVDDEPRMDLRKVLEEKLRKLNVPFPK